MILRELLTRTGFGEAPTIQTICLSDLQENLFLLAKELTSLQTKNNIKSAKKAVKLTLDLEKRIAPLMKERLQELRKELESKAVRRGMNQNTSGMLKERKSRISNK